MADITEILDSYIDTSTHRGFAEVFHSDIVVAQQNIVALRAQVDRAKVDMKDFKAVLRQKVIELRKAIEAERREANAEIERLDNLLDTYRIELQEAANEIERLRGEDDY